MWTYLLSALWWSLIGLMVGLVIGYALGYIQGSRKGIDDDDA